MSQDRAGDRAGFFGLVAALRAFRAGPLGGEPSDRALARAAGVSPDTIGNWLAGKRLPKDEGQFLAVVRAVVARAAARGVVPAGGEAGLLDEGCWRAAWRAENQRRAGTVSAGIHRAAAGRVLAGMAAGRPLGEVTDPFALEVHRPVQVEDGPTGLSALPEYVRRGHDEVLGRVVRAAAGGRSGIAVLVGGSSTGKTRACWEALGLLRDQPEPWRLWHPIDPSRPDAALRDLPGIGPRTVVWLNEAQFYLGPAGSGLGERVAAGLRELLRDPGRAPVLVLATLWPRFWDVLAARPDGDADSHAQARELLAGRAITVPAAFTAAQMGQLGQAQDVRLALAARSAADGEVIQFLAGAPELLARYRHAPPAARALIEAAMDARRLGTGAGLPQAFLEAAAPGYLTDAEWNFLGEDWLEQALAYTAVPCKGARAALTRIRPRPARTRTAESAASGHGSPAYQLADYLDQHGRAHRASQIPPAEFWAAAASHTTPGDQAALGAAAHARGLYRNATQLYKNAATSGHHDAIRYLAQPPGSLRSHPGPAHWAAAHVPLDYPGDVAVLLGRLRGAGAHDQAAVLLARDPAAHVRLDSPYGVAWLLGRLRGDGADEQAAALAGRAAAHVRLDSPRGVAVLLGRLREAWADEQAAVLLARDPAAHVRLDSPYGVAWLLGSLREAGADEQAAALAARAAAHVRLDDPRGVAVLLGRLREGRAHEQAAALAGRAAAHVPLDDPRGVAWLLGRLRGAGADEQAAALAGRAAAHVRLDDPREVAVLLGRLRGDGADEQAAALAGRAAAHVPLDSPRGVAVLLGRLRGAGADEQAAALAGRAAAHVRLDDPRGVAVLLGRLRGAGADEQAAALAGRAAAHVRLDDPRGVAVLLGRLREAWADEQAAALLARDPAAHVPLDNPRGVAWLLGSLREAGADEQAAALAARAAAHVPLDDPDGVAWLLGRLREGGADEQAAALAGRAAAHVPLDNPRGVADLLDRLREAGAHEQAAALLARDPAAHVPLDNPRGVARLLDSLRGAGADEQAAALICRLPAAGMYGLFLQYQTSGDRFHFGLEADGTHAAAWNWEGLDLYLALAARRQQNRRSRIPMRTTRWTTDRNPGRYAHPPAALG